MKKFAFTTLLLAIISFGLNTNTVEAGGNYGIKAKIAFNKSCRSLGAIKVTKPFAIMPCYNAGYIMRVNIIPIINCYQVNRSLIRIGAIGHVDFNCAGTVIGVVCY